MPAALGFWATVKLLVTILPELWEFAKTCGVWVNGVLDAAQTRKRANEMLRAINHAIETGDTSQVEDVFRNGGRPPSTLG